MLLGGPHESHVRVGFQTADSAWSMGSSLCKFHCRVCRALKQRSWEFVHVHLLVTDYGLPNRVVPLRHFQFHIGEVAPVLKIIAKGVESGDGAQSWWRGSKGILMGHQQWPSQGQQSFSDYREALKKRQRTVSFPLMETVPVCLVLCLQHLV